MNGALTTEMRAGRPVFPMLEVEWASRGYDLGTVRFARGGAILADGAPTLGIVPVSGFKECSYGPGMKGNKLVAARTSVKLNDANGTLQAMLETYDPRGSLATIRWVSPRLVSADWEPIFTGLVEDWKIQNSVVELLLKTNDAPLQSPGPKPIFSRSEWGSAYDQTIWGTAMPWVAGIHDSYKVTGRGMVPATNVKWNTDLKQYWWQASITNLKSIPRIYYDGAVKETGFSVVRGMYGGTWGTFITVDEANAPTDGQETPKLDGSVVVSFDCEGPDSSGGITGDPITNPIEILRAFLNNYVFRDNRSGVWESDHSSMDTASWDTVSAYFDLYGYEGAFRIGGGERDPALKVIESFLDSKPWVRMWWTPTGKLAIGVIPHSDPDVAEADWLNASTKVSDKDFRYEPGDRREVVSGIICPYLYSHSESKHLGSYEAHDLSVLPPEERISEEVEDEFSQGRYDQE